jgi:hypothetical protein
MAPSPKAKRAAQKPDDLPLEERIRRRAHELYVVRGNESGSDVEDWLQAEQEIKKGHA